MDSAQSWLVCRAPVVFEVYSRLIKSANRYFVIARFRYAGDRMSAGDS